MADSMVTSMARAGFSEAWSRFPNDFGPSFDHDAELFEAIARRMIKVMREPTAAMIKGLFVIEGWSLIKGRHHRSVVWG